MKAFYLALFCCAISVISCKKDDPCSGVVCNQNQYCNNGVCECEYGYGGFECDTQVVPSKIRISEIRLTRFPMLKPDGYAWDAISPKFTADVYVTLKVRWSGKVFYRSFSRWDQDYNDVTYWYSDSNQIYFPRPFYECVISLYDEDRLNSEDDFIGAATFSPYPEVGKEPPTLFINNGSIALELDVEYFW